MDNMDFRKWLTSYGYTYEQYQEMDEAEKKKVEKRFKAENTGENFKKVGDGLKGLGCLIILIPIAAVLLFIIFNILT